MMLTLPETNIVSIVMISEK